MPIAPRTFRPAGQQAVKHEGRTARQIEYRKWYRRMPWTDGKQGGLRGAQLQRVPLCEECAKQGHVTAASVVDHRVPHRGNWELFIDETNHVSLCIRHHAEKTGRGE